MPGKIITTLLLVSFALTLLPTEFAQAQEEGQVIVLSPKVGQTIDREEYEYYGLSLTPNDFHSAVILQLPDGSYIAEITEEIDGKEQLRRRAIDENVLEELREHIDSFEISFETYLRAKKNPSLTINKGLPLQMDGKLLGLKGTSLLLEGKRPSKKSEPSRIAIEDIQTITTKKSLAPEGCLGGMLVGATTAVIIGRNQEEKFLSTETINVIAFSIIFVPLGGVIGGIVGSHFLRDSKTLELSILSYDEKIEIVMKLSGL